MTTKNTLIGFYLPIGDLEEFDKIVDQERTSRAALLRKCVLERIKEENAC